MSEQPKSHEAPKDRLEILRERGMVSVDLGLTPKERDAITEVRIEKNLPQFNYRGSADEKLVHELCIHLGQLEGNSQEVLESIARLIARATSVMQQDLYEESVWVMVRVSLPNNEFDIPRWHQDGHYAKPPREEEYKLVFTVKGPSTRFAEIVDRKKYEQYDQADISNIESEHEDLEKYQTEDRRIRESLATAVEEIEPVTDGVATIYRVGSKDATVHSEPPMNVPRIFVSVVAGTPE